jgi:hypothetical protein
MPIPEQTRPKGHAHRVHTALVVFALCVALGSAPSRAVAQDAPAPPPGDGEVVSAAVAPAPAPEEGSSPMLWVYLLSLVSAVGLVAVYAWRRVEQRRYYEDGFTLAGDGPPPIVALAASEPRRAPTLGEELGLTGALALRVPSEEPLFTLRGDGPPKECPECQRQFASWMVVCPHDAAPLRAPKVRTRRPHQPGEKELARARCPKCERRYAEETRYCPHDGESLVADTTAAAAAAEPLVLCRACGKESEVDAPSCCDDPDVLTADPRDTRAMGGGVSLLVCPQCHTYGRFGSVQCAHDGEFLIPSSMLPPSVLPPTGWGDRKKMCPKCGAAYSGASHFCAHDGARLKALD